jgi:hypothetical protein
MLNYVIRRLLYAIPILLGVNLLTFALFFMVNTPDDMARIHLGAKHVTPESIARWKSEHGYDKPLFFNDGAAGVDKAADTLFVEKSLKLFVLDFGAADDGRDIAREIKTRMWPSLAIALPTFLVGLLAYISSPCCWCSSAARPWTPPGWCCAWPSCRFPACSTSSAASTSWASCGTGSPFPVTSRGWTPGNSCSCRCW